GNFAQPERTPLMSEEHHQIQSARQTAQGVPRYLNDCSIRPNDTNLPTFGQERLLLVHADQHIGTSANVDRRPRGYLFWSLQNGHSTPSNVLCGRTAMAIHSPKSSAHRRLSSAVRAVLQNARATLSSLAAAHMALCRSVPAWFNSARRSVAGRA